MDGRWTEMPMHHTLNDNHNDKEEDKEKKRKETTQRI